MRKSRFSIDPDNPYGKGVCGQAIRSQKPAVNPDILNSEQARPWREANLVDRAIACAALPLIRKGQSIGLLMFFIGQVMGRGRRNRRADSAHGRERLVRPREF